jgi:hypothetical protein
MKTGIAILFLAMFMATYCHKVPSQRPLEIMSVHQKKILKKVLHPGIDLVRIFAISELERFAPAIMYTLGIPQQMSLTRSLNMPTRPLNILSKEEGD